MYDNIVPTYSINMPFADFLLFAIHFTEDFCLIYFAFLGVKLGLSLIKMATD